MSGLVTIANNNSTLNYTEFYETGADIITRNPQNALEAGIFCYETGAQMFEMIAPARRVGFIANEGTYVNFNENGWKIFDATILWALGEI